MSLPETVVVDAGTTAEVVVEQATASTVVIEGGSPGPPGPPGPPGEWTQLTQAEYNALAVKDPGTLYVIVG